MAKKGSGLRPLRSFFKVKYVFSCRPLTGKKKEFLCDLCAFAVKKEKGIL
jgi:hypothetical protein